MGQDHQLEVGGSAISWRWAGHPSAGDGACQPLARVWHVSLQLGWGRSAISWRWVISRKWGGLSITWRWVGHPSAGGGVCQPSAGGVWVSHQLEKGRSAISWGCFASSAPPPLRCNPLCDPRGPGHAQHRRFPLLEAYQLFVSAALFALANCLRYFLTGVGWPFLVDGGSAVVPSASRPLLETSKCTVLFWDARGQRTSPPPLWSFIPVT